MLASGFVDTFRALHPDEQQFSYYSYRFNARAKNKGWRLDYFVISQALMANVVRPVTTAADVWSQSVSRTHSVRACVRASRWFRCRRRR